MHGRRVVLAPDKFKGSAAAAEVCRWLAEGLSRVPGVEAVSLPVADGGDGTVDAAVAAGFTAVPVTVTGATGRRVDAVWARRGSEAVVELANTCGLALVPPGERAATTASSRGVGEALAAALDAGCRRIVLGIGGSASTDGGAGMLQALGARLLAGDGSELPPGGAALQRVARLDLTRVHARLRDAELVVASDVDNPLCGPAGAAAVYGPQKGADPDDVRLLDAALQRWAEVVADATGADHRDDAGAGAAGGVGFGAVALLGASLRPGFDLLADLFGLRPALSGAALVVTGEGALDGQTLRGKAPAGVAAMARAAGVPVVAVAGSVAVAPAELAAAGITRAYALSDLEPDAARSIAEPGPLLTEIGQRIAGEWLGARP